MRERTSGRKGTPGGLVHPLAALMLAALILVEIWPESH